MKLLTFILKYCTEYKEKIQLFEITSKEENYINTIIY